MSDYNYADEFFDYVDVSSGRSAHTFLQRIQPALRVTSVLDVGCGRGIWLAAWQNMGVIDVYGLDGDYVDVSSLKIEAGKFRPTDVGAPFDLQRKFDLVQCLEVAEHIDGAKSDVLIDNLVRHTDQVLFSAAVPGQGGEHHVNERRVTYWAEKFRARGYRVFDFPRRAVAGLREIEPWYRFNALLYVKADRVDQLPGEVLRTEIKADESVPEYAPLVWRVRCTLLSFLPQPAVHKLAQVKHWLVVRSRRA